MGYLERMIAMRKLIALFTFLAFVCIPAAAISAEMDYNGTISIQSRMVEAGASFTAEVRLSGNDANLTSMIIPVQISSGYITCTGITFSGSLDGGAMTKSYDIDGSHIKIYYMPATDQAASVISATSGVIATLQLHADAAAPDYFVTIDAVEEDMSFEANGQIFSRWDRIELADDMGSGALLPNYSPSVITIQKVTDIADGTEDLLPDSYELSQNYPNPFNPATTIQLALPQKSNVRLEIFNLLGQRVASLINGELEAGYHEINWDAGNAPSGVYFYRLTADSHTLTRKMLLLK